MTGRVKQLWAALTLLCLLVGSCPLPVRADEDGAEDCRERLLQYYCLYQSEASREIEDCLETLETEDPEQGRLWRRIFVDWDWTNREMALHPDVLPDDLPQDDSMCIVVLGYGLNADGTMKPELYDRLRTALASARKYPNAYVTVTGGATSAVRGVTEAGEMAAWLKANGIAGSRIIVEDQSYTTTQNAQNTYEILCSQYPQVRQIAVITSDYHIRWGCTLFRTVSTYEAACHGGREIPVVGNAVCATETPDLDTLAAQARGIAAITGVSIGNSNLPALFVSP